MRKIGYLITNFSYYFSQIIIINNARGDNRYDLSGKRD